MKATSSEIKKVIEREVKGKRDVPAAASSAGAYGATASPRDDLETAVSLRDALATTAVSRNPFRTDTKVELERGKISEWIDLEWEDSENAEPLALSFDDLEMSQKRIYFLTGYGIGRAPKAEAMKRLCEFLEAWTKDERADASLIICGEAWHNCEDATCLMHLKTLSEQGQTIYMDELTWAEAKQLFQNEPDWICILSQADVYLKLARAAQVITLS